ncbi:hypothetical protein [Paraburkholderia pallida]|uniref:Uncharacterized protein n=1 Tax=Paraburkholderia pallida TaxID=2547399 RepID=A0A4P7CQS9_9BURK|nr:hypothetical protein [Paraburkholderia pallida]QBQ98185.1 hypothetical protein E1956_14045 [Paraburkholderia pallida]
MKDIDEIRRTNLRLLEEEYGSPTSVANALSMSLAQFANLRDGAKDSKTGKKRGMRKETARRIDSAAGKPDGWLDVDHSAQPIDNVSKSKREPAGWEKLDESGRLQVEAFIRGLLARPLSKSGDTDDDRPRGD